MPTPSNRANVTGSQGNSAVASWNRTESSAEPIINKGHLSFASESPLAPAQDDVDVDGDGHVMLMMATTIVRMMLMLIAEDDECTNNGRSDDDDIFLATLPQTLCTMPTSLHPMRSLSHSYL